MMRKGTQRRLAAAALALTALSPVALLVRPASAFPPGDPVSKFNYKFAAKAHIAKLKQTMSPQAGTFKGTIDRKTGQLKGAISLPPVTFAAPGAGLKTATIAFVPTKPVTGRVNKANSRMTATSTFVLHVVTANGTAKSHATHAAAAPRAQAPVTLPTLPITLPTLPPLPVPVTLPPVPGTLPTIPITLPPVPGTLPPVNMVGNACSTAPITMILNGIAQAGSITKFTGSFTIPNFDACGTLTGLLNSLLAGPGNSFGGTASPGGSASPPPTCLLPPLPITLPTLPIPLPVTLPTLPCNLPPLPLPI